MWANGKLMSLWIATKVMHIHSKILVMCTTANADPCTGTRYCTSTVVSFDASLVILKDRAIRILTVCRDNDNEYVVLSPSDLLGRLVVAIKKATGEVPNHECLCRTSSRCQW